MYVFVCESVCVYTCVMWVMWVMRVCNVCAPVCECVCVHLYVCICVYIYGCVICVCTCALYVFVWCIYVWICVWYMCKMCVWCVHVCIMLVHNIVEHVYLYTVCDAYVWYVKCVLYYLICVVYVLYMHVYVMCLCVIFVCELCVVCVMCVMCMISMCDIYVCLCMWCVSMCNVIICMWCICVYTGGMCIVMYVICVVCAVYLCSWAICIVYACSMYVYCMWCVLCMCVHESCKCACGGKRETLNINSWSRVSCCWHICQGTWLATSWGFTYLHLLLCCSSFGRIVVGFYNFFLYVLGIWSLILTFTYQSFNCLAISASPLWFFLVTIFHNLDSITSSSRRHVKTKTHDLVRNDVLRPCKLPFYVDKNPPIWKRKVILLYCEVLMPSLRIHHSLSSLPAAPWKLTHILFFIL